MMTLAKSVGMFLARDMVSFAKNQLKYVILHKLPNVIFGVSKTMKW